MTESAPIVSLLAPKNVSIGDIEGELAQIWQSYNPNNNDGIPATRATTFTFMVYEPEETQPLLAALGFYTGPIDGIMGPRTASALKDAQKAYGLPRTAKADGATLQRLREELTKKLAQPNTDGGKTPILSADPQSGYGLADAIAAANPCRVVAICPSMEANDVVTAQVSAYCPVKKYSSNSFVCCEYITLRGTAEAIEQMGGMVSALRLPELPAFLWWKATPDLDHDLFKRLSVICNNTIVDSAFYTEVEDNFLRLQTLIDQGIAVSDLNWKRIAAWQELTAAAFDPPERRSAIYQVDRVTIDYEKGNPAQALMFLGWLASRLQWKPISYNKKGGDYDLRNIEFLGANQSKIEAELAGIPTADSGGNIPGDLIALKLASLDPNADCGTVLCSETGGCMRMETKGGAQNYRFQQVTSLSDQDAESLLSQQLRRWGRDALFEESLALTASILRLS